MKEIAQSLAAVMQAANRPLRIDATKDLAGVTGTFRLSNGPYGTVGARRLVCKTDGSIAVEEVLLTESNADGSRFRYVVWNYTGPKYRDVDYAVGEFVRTQPAPGKTHINWTYRFALKRGTQQRGKVPIPEGLPRARALVVDAHAVGQRLILASADWPRFQPVRLSLTETSA